jgi:hypothetical protein
MNIISDAKQQEKPLHIIFTDIKGAFPSEPFTAFTHALSSVGLNNEF